MLNSQHFIYPLCIHYAILFIIINSSFTYIPTPWDTKMLSTGILCFRSINHLVTSSINFCWKQYKLGRPIKRNILIMNIRKRQVIIPEFSGGIFFEFLAIKTVIRSFHACVQATEFRNGCIIFEGEDLSSHSPVVYFRLDVIGSRAGLCKERAGLPHVVSVFAAEFCCQ